MRVSALVTTFNHAPFIRAALDSLLAQSHRDLEIIVVDDGSQDGTIELVAPYEARGVIFLQSSGDGPSKAMNTALAHATGDIFMLQSGDDASTPNRAELQVTLLASVDLVFSEPFLIDALGQSLPDSAMKTFVRRLPSGSQRLFRSLVIDGNFLCASSAAFTRLAWEKVGAFNNGLLQLQDYEYWLRALCAGLTISVSEQRIAYYRWHQNNLSGPSNDRRSYRELAFILRNLARTAPDQFLNAVHFGVPAEDKSQLMPRIALEALTCLRHGSELVRQAGADMLFEAMNHPTFEEDFGQLGIDRRALFHVMLAG